MRAIAGSILILAAVLFHRSPAAFLPLGRCLLLLMVLSGIGYFVLDLTGRSRPPYFAALFGRFWRWLLTSGNFLIKGTIMGALVAMLVNLIFFGGSQVGNLAAIPGAFIGLVLGVTLDAVAHRYRYRSMSPPTDIPQKPVEVADMFARDERSLLVESHGWDLSLGILPHQFRLAQRLEPH